MVMKADNNRKPLIAGNWKMNGSREMTRRLCQELVKQSDPLSGIDMVICPPFTLIPEAYPIVSSSALEMGAQDLDVNDSGAFTGQVAASMLVDWHCRYVIVGHSERRSLYGETNHLVALKTETAIQHDLIPIVCIGETLDEREADATFEVVNRQIKAIIDHNGIDVFTKLVIAYEPVWAIGTGLTATPQQAQTVHHQIRTQLEALSPAVAEQCRILYGGSMKPGNAADLLAQPDIDGGLIGGAALNADDFIAICSAAG